MRKDFIPATDAEQESEIAFVERYWTEVWQHEGGPRGAMDEIPRKAEFRIMQPYLEKMTKGARLLDGGCGLGDWTLYLTSRGWPTLGLDISRHTVAELQKRFPDAEFAVGDIRDTGLPDASFDGYYSWGTFEHFEEGLERCVAEAYRVLKSGGYLFTTVPFDNLRHALRAAGDWRRRAAPAAASARFYQWRLTRGELRALLSRGGFEVVDLRPIHTRQGLMRSLHHEFGLPYGLVSRGLGAALAPLVPAGLVAHMLMAIARKPAGDVDPKAAA